MDGLSKQTKPNPPLKKVLPDSVKASSLERMLRVLDIFTEEAPIWAVDDMGAVLGYTRSTVYRYVRELADADLLFQVEAGRYTLGARIITWDRQLRVSDPLVRAAKQLEPQLPRWSEHQVWLVCRLFKNQVVCIHQSGALTDEVSYARGTPRPLFMGATSKAILANLGTRQHSQLFLENPELIRHSNLGQTWDDFRRSLQRIRRKGFVISAEEVDVGVFGLAAPIFDGDGKVVGSISCVRPIQERDITLDEQQGQQIVVLAENLTQLAAALSQRPNQLG
ncbi:IclR family transcriptional regulator [Pseudomonas mohnii]|jgi:DNA-binding IclR family transcriptional regulator|uniref:IclR family transcriptional regulator n=1 Tax=Pseudomonas sp. MIL9 TaxID=2807620 RepID=UPI00102A9EBE|nr:IclR family transcriptional regulator C-terminal domain-containing protein [Pseudomonas sp. MIL9]MBM6443861.1 helix-turn-helix domain-containing protein [Pseudomonas sp. MIL9]RZO06859.1 IclR family transcriptional regulator [Pseudomonas moorei]